MGQKMNFITAHRHLKLSNVWNMILVFPALSKNWHRDGYKSGTSALISFAVTVADYAYLLFLIFLILA